MEVIMSLDQLVDESDPDVDFPNSFHAFQTAEGIRQVHPDKGCIDRTSNKIQRGRVKLIREADSYIHCFCADWFQLVGLIHDVGKIMALWDEPQVRGRFNAGKNGKFRLPEHNGAQLCFLSNFTSTTLL